MQIESFKFNEWLTGFFEGDGTTFCTERMDGQGYKFLRPVICFTQKEPQILEYIKSEINSGHLYFAGERPGWHLKLDSKKMCKPLLQRLSPYLTAALSLKRTNAVLSKLDMSIVDRNKVTLNWFVGFWDAEGYSSVQRCNHNNIQYTYLKIGVSHKDKGVLTEISQLFGGKIYDKGADMYEWCFQRDTIHSFVMELLLYHSKNLSKHTKLLEDISKCG